ncbi:MAG: hypothetical protein ACRDH5_06695, partial [bacterium]
MSRTVMRRCWIAMAMGLLAAMPAGAEARSGEAADEESRPFQFDIGFELKSHLRDSEQARLPVNFPFRLEQLPPGQTQAFLETVN